MDKWPDLRAFPSLTDEPECRIVRAFGDGMPAVNYSAVVQLGENSTLRVGDQLTIYAIDIPLTSDSNFSKIGFNRTIQGTSVSIGNASNPVC